MGVTVSHIEAVDLEASYTPGGSAVFPRLSFSILPGEALTILGPNGAGKSTLLKCLTGLLAPSSGRVALDGVDIGRLSHRERARRLALVSQSETSVFAFDVVDVVVTGRASHLGMFSRPEPRDREIAMEALDALGVTHLAARSFNELSGGQKQLVRIARALAQGSGILVLDEPASHLDLANQMLVLKAISNLLDQQRTIVMTSHDPLHAFVCGGQTLLLGRDDHTIGKVQDVVTEDNLSRLFSSRLKLLQGADDEIALAPDLAGLVRNAPAHARRALATIEARER